MTSLLAGIRSFGLAAALACAGLTASTHALGFALGTDFTYQGKLALGGAAVNGSADFQFRLYASPEGSGQIGSTYSLNAVDVHDGVFTVPLDFGASAFNGEARWLEIAVRSPAGSGNFVILTPRQYISAAPYSILSLKPWGMNSGNTYFENGGVGIGTTNPQGKLDVRSGNSSYVRIDGSNGDVHGNGGSDGIWQFFNDAASNNARIDFLVNGQTQMSMAGDGRVGIGTTAPAALRKLTVKTPEIFTGRFESAHPIGSTLELSNTTGGLWEWGVTGNTPPAGLPVGAMYFYKNGEQDVAMAMAPNQWIGMGVNDPGFRLDLPNFGNNDGRGRANQWVTYSSARWKENVEPIEHALDMVTKLRGVTFDWKKEHGGSRDVGFVAEEVGKVLPELVTWEADGVWAQGLAYDRITAVTVEAIKEQQSQIEAMKEANAELRAEVERLKELVAAAGATSAR